MSTTDTSTRSDAAAGLREARDRLVALQQDHSRACEEFRWPRFEHFNFGLDWFDGIAAGERAHQEALVIAEADGTVLRRTFAQLSADSNRVANWLSAQGMSRGDRMILMLGNQVELWELMLAGIKLGAVLIPTATQMGPVDLQDRVRRGEARWAAAGPADLEKFGDVEGELTLIHVPGARTPDEPAPQIDAPSGAPRTVLHYEAARKAAATFTPGEPTGADDTLLLYFTSGTTSLPKLVEHTHTSYPVGHLSTLYWIGMQPGDVHLNVAGPGWAKHAWSNFFTPWIAEATIFIYNYARFDATELMTQMDAHGVSSFCAPPTVWRMLIQADLTQLRRPPRVTVSAGEPLNAEVIDQVERAWGCTIRDGFGQTETTLQVANTPGQPLVRGSMGRPLPGFDVVLIDPRTGEEAQEGELCLRAEQSGPARPVGLMKGYAGDPERTAEVFRNGLYHTGDVVRRDEDGVLTYVGRSDDVFKSSDYRISPFELESVLVEHPAVAEAAVVPAADELRLAVPKAYVVLAAGWEWTAETATSILTSCREKLPPFKRIRRIERIELPKTISGKIRRVELRALEESRGGERGVEEFRDAELPAFRR
ncbi:AMP-binding protein [Nesterenkonia sp. HG001]|uniref:AMP-binding protein n=1 Tax=Nesterenkonia sp. HG001 TaxID=2983207 RepID=UPI002AC59317|nr:AMP-binding protein [Nesterenkonia sp. HG001]MDZ5077628.1 AMP-binding protein [Nesterenkonia sp. HG001]